VVPLMLRSMLLLSLVPRTVESSMVFLCTTISTLQRGSLMTTLTMLPQRALQIHSQR
jgi:hypothetical protein